LYQAVFAGPLFAMLRFLGNFCSLVSRREFRWVVRSMAAPNKESGEWGRRPIRPFTDFGFC
jgi:hypothetical protein